MEAYKYLHRKQWEKVVQLLKEQPELLLERLSRNENICHRIAREQVELLPKIARECPRDIVRAALEVQNKSGFTPITLAQKKLATILFELLECDMLPDQYHSTDMILDSIRYQAERRNFAEIHRQIELYPNVVKFRAHKLVPIAIVHHKHLVWLMDKLWHLIGDLPEYLELYLPRDPSPEGKIRAYFQFYYRQIEYNPTLYSAARKDFCRVFSTLTGPPQEEVFDQLLEREQQKRIEPLRNMSPYLNAIYKILSRS